MRNGVVTVNFHFCILLYWHFHATVCALFMCIGEVDCTDQSDEANCTQVSTTSDTCLNDFFRCGDGTCIPPQYQCDGTADCSDNSDESLHCKSHGKCHEFLCPTSGRCIPDRYRCDGDVDCSPGGEDGKSFYTQFLVT